MNLGVEFIYNLKVVAFSVIQNYSHLKFKEFPKVHFIASYGCIAHSTNKSVRKSKTKLLQQTFCCSIHMASRLAHYLAIGRTPEWICGHLLLLFFLWGGEGRGGGEGSVVRGLSPSSMWPSFSSALCPHLVGFRIRLPFYLSLTGFYLPSCRNQHLHQFQCDLEDMNICCTQVCWCFVCTLF